MSRKVTVYNTLGGNMTDVMSDATTWKELQSDLTRYGVPYSNMSAVIGETQVTLESDVAQLLQGDFQLFLVAKKVKSGQDEEYLNSLDGITWDEIDWDYTREVVVEDHLFKTLKDLTIARAKKAQSYLQDVIDYLIQEEKKTVNDPEIVNLQRTADEIKRNLGIFD